MTRRSVLILAAVALVGVLAGAQTWAAFDAKTTNDANSIASGTVKLTDDDLGVAMMTMSGAVPGHTRTRCTKISYAGTLASAVHFYGTTSAGGLDEYLDLKVTRGAFSGTEPAFPGCTNFTADTTTYIVGQDVGVIYHGTLEDLPDDYATGVVDPSTGGGAESWNDPESHVYQIEVTLNNNAAAEGKSATQTFTWEAQNT